MEQEREVQKVVESSREQLIQSTVVKKIEWKVIYLFVDLSVPFVVIVVVITVVEVESVATGSVVVGAPANNVNVAGVLEVGV